MRRVYLSALPIPASHLIRRYSALAFILAVALIRISFAQDPTAGIQPFSTQIGAGYTSIDAATNSVFVSIPVRSKTGKIPFSFNVVWTSHAWNSLNPNYVLDKTPEYLWSVNTTLSDEVSVGGGLGIPTHHCYLDVVKNSLV